MMVNVTFSTHKTPGGQRLLGIFTFSSKWKREKFKKKQSGKNESKSKNENENENETIKCESVV
jgi:hypothetical protein|uniref:Uncharacterized protein n=1 Tax=viral metagenome TaxID=1070528 RepID=A0A6C0M117_9ZZZZ